MLVYPPWMPVRRPLILASLTIQELTSSGYFFALVFQISITSGNLVSPKFVFLPTAGKRARVLHTTFHLLLLLPFLQFASTLT